ncbi:MAG: ABC transporter substrate-binding protein [Lachnospiraceae bacterium]|nr:ABC transporter substrate-binding protein [Lachnospiraceae bacterium]
MRRIIRAAVAALVFAAVFTGCNVKVNIESKDQSASDTCPERVIALSKSNAALWLLAGGELIATSDDAMDLDGIGDAVSLGDMDHVSLEAVAALEPDMLIVFSEDPAQKALGESAVGLGLNVKFINIDSFDDYDQMMEYFTSLTGRSDLYTEYVSDVRTGIDAVTERVPEDAEPKTYLLVHASATKCKAEKNTYFACEIFNDLGLKNIADDDSDLNELSLESIVSTDPDYIFVVPRGNEDKALKSFDELFGSKSAWSDLSAVKSGQYYILSKDLFGLKPNDRWADSYEEAFEILYGK